MQRIGIISGVEDELAAFLPGVTRTPIELGPLSVEHVSYAGKDCYLLCLGIGKVAAAAAAALLHAHCAVELLIVIGTAGKIAEIDDDLFNIIEAVQADFGAQRSDGLAHYTAGTWPIGVAEVQAFEAMPLPDLGLPTARIATSDLFIECGIHAAKVRDALDVTIADMETAAVAQVATLLDVPWAAIKATTDSADGDSAGSFVANLAAAARAAAQATEEVIRLL